jgi:hypothetical protein
MNAMPGPKNFGYMHSCYLLIPLGIFTCTNEWGEKVVYISCDFSYLIRQTLILDLYPMHNPCAH